MPHSITTVPISPDLRAVVQPAALRLLAAGVPLSLLMDLADPLGPDSVGIMRSERQLLPVRVVDIRVIDITDSAAGVAS